MTRAIDDEPDDEADASHLDDVEDGAGCTEIWEYMSDARERSEADE